MKKLLFSTTALVVSLLAITAIADIPVNVVFWEKEKEQEQEYLLAPNPSCVYGCNTINTSKTNKVNFTSPPPLPPEVYLYNHNAQLQKSEDDSWLEKLEREISNKPNNHDWIDDETQKTINRHKTALLLFLILVGGMAIKTLKISKN